MVLLFYLFQIQSFITGYLFPKTEPWLVTFIFAEYLWKSILKYTLKNPMKKLGDSCYP